MNEIGLKNSGLDNDKRRSLTKAIGYEITNKNPVIAPYNNISLPAGAGGMYSTVLDLYKWDKELLSNKHFDKQLTSKLFTPNRGNYGYGWEISPSKSHPEYRHAGSIEGFLSYNSFFPKDSFILVILSNHVRSEMQMQPLVNALSALLLKEKYDLPRYQKEIKIDADTLKNYVGQFQMGNAFIIKISVQSDHLYMQVRDDKPMQLLALDKNEFYLKDIDSKLSFKRNNSNQVNQLLLRDGGETMELHRIQ